MKVAGLTVIWKVSPKNTGPFKSFQYRSWPSAFLHSADGPILFQLLPVEDNPAYDKRIAETTELIVRINDRRGKEPVWRRLKVSYMGVTAAKEGAMAFLQSHPEYAGD